MGSPMARSHLTLSYLERSNSRSLRFGSLISRKTAYLPVGPMLLLKINRKPYTWPYGESNGTNGFDLEWPIYGHQDFQEILGTDIFEVHHGWPYWMAPNHLFLDGSIGNPVWNWVIRSLGQSGPQDQRLHSTWIWYPSVSSPCWHACKIIWKIIVWVQDSMIGAFQSLKWFETILFQRAWSPNVFLCVSNRCTGVVCIPHVPWSCWLFYMF